MEKIRLPIFDGHNDSIQMMYVPDAKKRSFLEETDSGHIDLPRAKRGGFDNHPAERPDGSRLEREQRSKKDHRKNRPSLPWGGLDARNGSLPKKGVDSPGAHTSFE